MKVKITKCTCINDPCGGWYHHLTGMTFDVVDTGFISNTFQVYDDYHKFIQKQDCEIVEENTDTTKKQSEYGKAKLEELLKIFPNMTTEEYDELYRLSTVIDENKQLREQGINTSCYCSGCINKNCKAKHVREEAKHIIDELFAYTDKVGQSKPIKKPRVPDENTPVDTLVRVRNNETDDWQYAYLKSLVRGYQYKIELFDCFPEGKTSKTSRDGKYCGYRICEIVEGTIEEKRKRIFHKYVPEKYKWSGVSYEGNVFLCVNKPCLDGDLGNAWIFDGEYISAGFADPTDFENSLLGREE